MVFEVECQDLADEARPAHSSALADDAQSIGNRFIKDDL